MGNSITQKLRYKQSVIKFSYKYGVTKAAIRFGENRRTIYRWRNRYDGTLESLKDKSRRPHHHPNEHTEEINLIKRYRANNKETGLVVLWVKLREVGYTRTIQGLYHVMQKLGIYKKMPSKKKGKQPTEWVSGTYPGEKVQIDVKYVPKECMSPELQERGERYYQYTAIDEFTRLRYTWFTNEHSTYMSSEFVKRLIKYFPFKIKTIQTDNGFEFTKRLSWNGFEKNKETIFESTLKELGIGYRAKTRFAKFHNLPELMSMFKEVADIQTAETLNLPTPEFENINVVVKPSEIQQEMVQSLGERAEKIRSGAVDASQDNMLKITNEGRKLALDQRLMNPLLPDAKNSKVNSCSDNIYKIWNENKDKKSTQLIFCDLSTPKDLNAYKKEEFKDIYNELKKKLIQKGIPPDEIAFIHEADTESKKKELFRKVSQGEVRVLMGSTQKMGAGTNVQDKLIAIHHLDCAWKPSDLTQRNGRMIRQGNENKKVFVYSYVTEKTFDSYMYQLVEQKQKFISQIMTSKTPARTMEDIDDKALTYGEIKALATGNPKILEKTTLDTEVSKLKLLKQEFMNQKYLLQDKVIKFFPEEIAKLNNKIKAMKEDIVRLDEYTKPNKDGFSPMKIDGILYTEKQDAGKKLLESIQSLKSMEAKEIGEYRGFKMEISFDSFTQSIQLKLKNKFSYFVDLGTDTIGNITRINNCLENISKNTPHEREKLENIIFQLENAKKECQKEFPKEQELREKLKKLDEINAELKINENDHEILGNEQEEKEDKISDKKSPERC